MDGELRPHRHPASFRDPGVRVYESGERILRGYDAAGAERYRRVAATGLLERLVNDGLLVSGRGIPAASVPGAELVLEHERIPFVSYPYEWPFDLLRRAALVHLDVHLRALDAGVTL